MNKIISILPITFFIIFYNKIPKIVPTHFDINSNIDSYGSKNVYIILMLLPIIFQLTSLVYLKIQNENLKSIVTDYTNYISNLFSTLAIFILFHLITKSNIEVNYIMIIISFYFILISNKLNKLNQNKYLGIRFKSTLSNVTVWNKTHFLGGYLMSIHSLITLLLSIIAIYITKITVFIIPYFVCGLLIILITLYFYSNKTLKSQYN